MGSPVPLGSEDHRALYEAVLARLTMPSPVGVATNRLSICGGGSVTYRAGERGGV
jgi:hypothetical protein